MPASLVINDLRGAIVGPVTLTVQAGICATIAGPSGSGKSLLLRMIADLEPNEGHVRLDSLQRQSIAAPDWRRRVIYVPAEAGWWAPNAQAHLPEGTTPYTEELVRRLGLAAEHLQRPIAMLSTGERQRLALLRALVRRPEVLLLDEPTSALDPVSVASVEAILRDTLAAGLILVVASHDADQARRFGSARYAMNEGHLSAA